MTPPGSSSPSPAHSRLLVSKLASVLPKGYDFGIYHISTPPTRCDALFHAPPGRSVDRTYRESHFLAVSIDIGASREANSDADLDTPRNEVFVFALEIFIYTTAFASTFFVSKADSSGYLHLLGLPRSMPSPIRSVSSTFISYLVEQRRRPHIQPVISLFARAQSQYLFPGSVDNKGKHVLDDRGLVKWWCRVLDGIVGRQDKGYLVVPGLDHYEMRSFIPRGDGLVQGRWTLSHPLETISHYIRESEMLTKGENDTNKTIPPRCLIPQYPDDPKARYLDELDDEAERAGQMQKADAKHSKSKGSSFGNGMWTSVKTLDQFWEMMAYRQECSSGRLTGFIWVVFDEPGAEAIKLSSPTDDDNNNNDDDDDDDDNAQDMRKKKSKSRVLVKTKTRRHKSKSQKLRGRIISRAPRSKTAQQQHYLAKQPATTRHYHWPIEGRGRLLVDEADYKRINELLLQLDFATLAKSSTSTQRWIKEAGIGRDWRLSVAGEAAYTDAIVASAKTGTEKKENGANDLSALIKRKRTVSTGVSADVNVTGSINVLSTGLVRKKPKPA